MGFYKATRSPRRFGGFGQDEQRAMTIILMSLSYIYKYIIMYIYMYMYNYIYIYT